MEWSVCGEHALETLLKSESSNSRPKNNGVMVLTAIAIATTNYYKIKLSSESYRFTNYNRHVLRYLFKMLGWARLGLVWIG